MRGNVTRRGRSSWRIKFDAGADSTGKRLIRYETVRGTKRQAEAALVKRINEISEGRFIPPTTETVETYARHWLESIAPVDRCAATVARYRTIITASRSWAESLSKISTAKRLTSSMPTSGPRAIAAGAAYHR